MRFVDLLVVLFPLWAVVGTAGALVWPDNLTPLRPAIIPLLGVVMFGMGLTLTAREFLEVARRPLLIASGAALQFGIMPFAAWAVGHAMGLQPDLLVGLILVGACPGGTASNVICYLARGDVALSITFTTVSTFLAILLTPALTWLYVGESVPVPVISMLLSILQIVILPVLAGVTVNRFFGARFAFLRGVFPLISVAAIVVIIAIVYAFVLKRIVASWSATLTSRSLLVRKGVFTKTERTIPLEKITDLPTTEGPIMRYFGLKSIGVETAGRSGGEGSSLVSVLGIVDTDDFRSQVLAQRELVTGSGATIDTDRHDASGGSPDELREIADTLHRIEDTLDRLAIRCSSGCGCQQSRSYWSWTPRRLPSSGPAVCCTAHEPNSS